MEEGIFTKETILIDAFQMEGVNVQAMAEALADLGMHCLGCMLSHGETIEQAAVVHGLDPDYMLDILNKAAVMD